jgi:CheY-like chemotaxis protein
MKEIIEWLISMEQTAREIYGDASRFFKEDKELERLLKHLAKDEAWHFHVMASAADFIKIDPQPPLTISLDNASKSRIEAPFHKNKREIIRGNLTKESLLNCIVSTEFSEWNYFFLYVVNALRGKRREFEYAASKMEHHKKLIERYIENLPNNRKYIKTIRHLPKVWNVKILIVEDNKPLRLMMSALLSTEGDVETAENGKRGLHKITKQFYDIILSNDFMPGMNGIELYKKSVQYDPLIAGRFLFLMDDITPGHIDFVRKNRIRYLIKPFPMHEVKKAMHSILSKTPRKSHIRIAPQTQKRIYHEMKKATRSNVV